MHIKHIHCMIEDLAEYGKCMIEAGTGNGNVNLCEAGQIVDMIKDLAAAEYHSLISKAMKEAEEEEKYMMKMLKEEHKDEYKKMREEYGEEDGERRFYDNYRYANGRFAPKGRGSYMPRSSGRRGYEEPPYYHMTPEMMREHDPEYWRDMDRMDGKMYYTPMSGNANMDNASGKSYADGVNEGTRRGYSDGYEKGMMDGKKNNSSRYDKARRGYEETKEMHKGNTTEDNTENMRGLEELLNVVGGDVKELSPKMSPSEKAMTAQKFDTWSKMLKQ